MLVVFPFVDSTAAQVGRSLSWPNPGRGVWGCRYVHHAAVAPARPPGLAPPPGARFPLCVFFHTDREVFAFDLERGRLIWRFGGWWGLGPMERVSGADRLAGTPAFFTTVAEGRVFVRLRVPRRSPLEPRRWAIYALAADSGRVLWSTECRRLLPPSEAGSAPADVLSDPAYAHGRLYFLVRGPGNFPEHHLLALRADTGEVLWRRLICSGSGSLRVFSHWPGGVYPVGRLCPPPTVFADTVIVPTNMGLVAGVDALTGQVRWVFRYERGFLSDGRSGEMRRLMSREVMPAVVSADCAVVAPRDTYAVFGLDVASGRLRWRLDLEDVQRIVGSDGAVSTSRVPTSFASTSAPVRFAGGVHSDPSLRWGSV